MSATAAEREPLLSTRSGDDSVGQNGGMKPGIVPQTVIMRILLLIRIVLATPNHLTGETFDNVPVRKRKLGEPRISPRLHQSSHNRVHELGLTSAIFVIFNRMIGTGLASIPLNSRSLRALNHGRTGSSLLRASS